MIDRGHVIGAGLLSGLLLLAVPAQAQISFRAASSAGVPASTTISLRAAAQAGAGSGVLTLTINRPTGTAQNDVMVATIGFRPNSATITPPSGWTLVRRMDNVTGTPSSLAVYWKVAGSSEPSNYSWSFSTSGGSVGGVMSFTGVYTSGPVNAENGQNTPTSLTHSTPDITTSVANTMLVASYSFGSSATWTTGSGMTEAVDVMSQGQGCCGQSLAAYYIGQGAAGATGAKTATASNDSDSGNAHLLALQPVGASLTISKPAGTIQNDVMIASVAVRPHTVTITPPAGWTLVRRMDNANATANSLAVYRKVAGASEPGSYTWTVSTHTGATGGIQTFVGVDPSSPIDVENGSNTPNGTIHQTPPVTTTVANTMLVMSYGVSNPGPNHWTPVSTMTEAFDATGGSEAIAGYYVLQAAAGSTGNMRADSAVADVGNAHILALRPLCPTLPADATYVAASAPSGTTSVTLYWASADPPLILRKTTAFGSEAPTIGQAYSAGDSIGGATVVYDGSAGVAGMTCGATSCTNTGLTNGTTYYYKIFPRNGNCYAPGTGAEVNAKPVATTTGIAWSYTLAGGPLLKAGIAGEGTLHTASNASRVISLNTANGSQTWEPVATNQPIQSWLTWLPARGEIKSVQSGTAVMTTASLDVSINPVTLARSVLFFNVQESIVDAGSASVRGQLTSPTNIRFNRAATGGTITIKWYVAEFGSGVSVQRGSTALTASPMNVTINSVDLGTTFVLASWQKPGSTFGNDDYLRGRLTSSTNLELSHDTGGSALDGMADWQVVSMANASVQSGDLSFASTDSSRTVTIASVDTTKSFLIASWTTNGSGIGANFVRGRITSPTQLTFDRGVTGAALNLTWFLVTLNDNSTVQSGNASFGTATTQIDVSSLASVTLSRSVAFLSGIQRGGSTPFGGASPNDDPGVGWFTADLTATTNLRLTRGATQSATAEAAWFVVEFTQGAGSATVIGGDQSGQVYLLDAATGATIWTANLSANADFIQATPAAHLLVYANAAFQAAYTDDVIFVGSRNAGDTNCGAGTSPTNNKLFALRASDGTVLWTFNDTCTNAVDWIVGMPYVDYGRNRLYVTSRAGAAGTQTSLWVIDTLSGTLVTPPSPLTLDHLEASPTLSADGNTVYVGNLAGTFYAVDATTLAVKWSLSLGGATAAIKGFVWEDPSSAGRLYFSTGSDVRCVQDNGAAGVTCPGWTPPSIAGASTLLLLDKIYVGSSDGKVHQINPADGIEEKQFPAATTLDGTQVGDVSTETGSELFVGTGAGKLYKIPLPLP